MIKIVSFKICPFVQRVTASLEAREIPYQIEYISLNDKPQWFLDISPNGQVPVLITDNGVALFESEAIVEFIEDQFGPLELDVTNEQRALDRAWSYLGSKLYLLQCSAMRSRTVDELAERIDKLVKNFLKAEKKFEGPLFKGETLSNVDIAWLPLLHRAYLIKLNTCVDMFEGFPNLQAWQQSIMVSKLVEKTVSDDFEALFSEFYLSTSTLLGQQKKDCSIASNGSKCC